MIDNFEDKYWFLSNFYPVKIHYEGLTYPSVEHAYQAAKTNAPLERWAILNTKSAGQAKRLGHRLHIKPNWDLIKILVMEDLLRLKFSQEPLRQMLIDTGEEELIEGNYWNDTYWGICRGEGQNNLGKLLMLIREELKVELKENIYVRS